MKYFDNFIFVTIYLGPVLDSPLWSASAASARRDSPPRTISGARSTHLIMTPQIKPDVKPGDTKITSIQSRTFGQFWPPEFTIAIRYVSHLTASDHSPIFHLIFLSSNFLLGHPPAEKLTKTSLRNSQNCVNRETHFIDCCIARIRMWRNLEPKILRNLVGDMPNRMTESLRYPFLWHGINWIFCIKTNISPGVNIHFYLDTWSRGRQAISYEISHEVTSLSY